MERSIGAPHTNRIHHAAIYASVGCITSAIIFSDVAAREECERRWPILLLVRSLFNRSATMAVRIASRLFEIAVFFVAASVMVAGIIRLR